MGFGFSRTYRSRLLPARRLPLRRPGEELAPVGERNARRVGRRRAIARLVSVDHEQRSCDEVLSPPASSVERVCPTCFAGPVDDLAVLSLYGNVNPGVRVGPSHLDDLTRQLDRLVRVVLG